VVAIERRLQHNNNTNEGWKTNERKQQHTPLDLPLFLFLPAPRTTRGRSVTHTQLLDSFCGRVAPRNEGKETKEKKEHNKLLLRSTLQQQQQSELEG
jgi:hypothetical protein